MFGMIPCIAEGVPCGFCGENGEGGKVKERSACTSVQMLRSRWETMTAKVAPWFPKGEPGLYSYWHSNWRWSQSHAGGRNILGIALLRAGLFPCLILSPCASWVCSRDITCYRWGKHSVRNQTNLNSNYMSISDWLCSPGQSLNSSAPPDSWE